MSNQINKPVESNKDSVRLLTPLDYYRSNRFFCNLQAILLTTSVSLMATMKDKFEITQIQKTPQSWVSVQLPTSENPTSDSDKNTPEASNPEPESKPEETNDSDQDAKNEAAQEKALAFKEKFAENFELDRQKLINKYQPYFELKSISSEQFDEFLFEYSSALETAVQKTKRDLGENELSDDEIRTKVQENQQDLKEFLDISESIVQSSENKARAISGVIKDRIEYKSSQASINGMFNTEKPQGNCVTRAIVAARTALKVGLLGVGFALMPEHIAAVTSKNGTTIVMDTTITKVQTESAGSLIEGGAMFASLLGVTPNGGEKPNVSRGGNGGSAYAGLSPTGPNSALKTPPRPQDSEKSNVMTDENYKVLISKYLNELSGLGNKEIQETIQVITDNIEDERLRTELLGELLEASKNTSSYDDYFYAEKAILASMAEKIRSQFSNPLQIGVDEALEKINLVKCLAQLASHGDTRIHPLTITSASESENARLDSTGLHDFLEIIYRPKTLRGLHGRIENLNVSNLENLAELIGEFKDEPVDETVSNQVYSVANDNTEKEDLKPLEILRAIAQSSQLAKLSQLDLSESKTKFGVEKPLNADEFKNLDGFSGTINFAIEKNVDLSILEQIDLSRMKLAADYRCMVKQLLVQKMDSLIIDSADDFQYLMENNILQNLKASNLVLVVYDYQKEFSKLAKDPTLSTLLPPGTKLRIEYIN